MEKPKYLFIKKVEAVEESKDLREKNVKSLADLWKTYLIDGGEFSRAITTSLDFERGFKTAFNTLKLEKQ